MSHFTRNDASWPVFNTQVRNKRKFVEIIAPLSSLRSFWKRNKILLVYMLFIVWSLRTWKSNVLLTLLNYIHRPTRNTQNALFNARLEGLGYLPVGSTHLQLSMLAGFTAKVRHGSSDQNEIRTGNSFVCDASKWILFFLQESTRSRPPLCRSHHPFIATCCISSFHRLLCQHAQSVTDTCTIHGKYLFSMNRRC